MVSLVPCYETEWHITALHVTFFLFNLFGQQYCTFSAATKLCCTVSFCVHELDLSKAQKSDSKKLLKCTGSRNGNLQYLLRFVMNLSHDHYFVWVVIWQVICRDITNTLILLFEVQAYQLEWNHSEEQTHFTRTGKTYFQMKFSLVKSTALASVFGWLTYPSPPVSAVGWGKLSTKHLIPTSIKTSQLPKIASFLWLYNLPKFKYDY